MDSSPDISESACQVAKWKPIVGLRILQNALSFSPESPSCYADAVFVSIHFFNNTHYRRKRTSVTDNAQAGLAILDTRHVSPETPAEKLVSAYNFVAGSETYFWKAKSRFLFGKTTVLNDTQELRQHIQDCIPKDRNIIIVGHGIGYQKTCLTKIGFDFESDGIVACLDPSRIAEQILEYKAGPFKRLLETLNIPISKLRAAGNDAHYIMQAVLILASIDCDKTEHPEKWHLLMSAARLPLPTESPFEAETLAEFEAAIAEKKERNRKLQCAREPTPPIDGEEYDMCAVGEVQKTVEKSAESENSEPEKPSLVFGWIRTMVHR
ncbi:hypothetical protein C8035_v006867 [Colletotrichum spinosum]|uniref:Gfd2/YDR514C-like C-terminal domain-containing protein n=1 Tax=Colletotrichum spinosum TaxID=1347390 RepID=A0A4R8QJ45_9PEZI|nr:hypothetical protein C8035_v006867 [Colletotrichum spinosum]